MPLELSEATEADSAAIGHLFALSWTSPFSRLQFGNIDTDGLAQTMAPRIALHMKKPPTKIIVIRNTENGDIASVAHWSKPKQEEVSGQGHGKKETLEEEEERQQVEDEAYRNGLPEGSNKDLIMDFTVRMRQVRKEVLGDRKHYLLENIATHPSYRRQGLASRLIEWPFPDANKDGDLVYLDTGLDNPALNIYKRLGFREVGRSTIEDLSRYGGVGDHTHVALIRYPRTQ